MSGSKFFADADVPTLVKQIQQLPRSEGDVVLLLIGEHSRFVVEELVMALHQAQIPIAGGVFTGVIYGNQTFDAGVVADVLPMVAPPSVITGLDTMGFRLGDLPTFPDDRQYTALMLVDGLTKHIASFLDRLFRRLRNTVCYIGGGAGSLSFEQMPCVFDSSGIYQDAALILWLKTATGLGVRHGWQHLRGPLMATRASGTQVHELDSRPAFEVYSEIIRSTTGEILTHENFFSIARQYPLGLYHPGADHIVRDPIAFTDDGTLICVGDVPSRAMVYVLRGDSRSLIDNAHLATTEVMNNGTISQHNLIVDCISRALFLEEDFDQELDMVLAALPDSAATPYGMLSLGEIATFKTGRVEFFNKTFVVGALQDIF